VIILAILVLLIVVQILLTLDSAIARLLCGILGLALRIF
jgi:hypothetical protein